MKALSENNNIKNTDSIEVKSVKMPFICQAWIIAICFMSARLVIPLVIGIVLLVVHYAYFKKINQALSESDALKCHIKEIEDVINCDIDDVFIAQKSISKLEKTIEILKEHAISQKNTAETEAAALKEQAKKEAELLKKQAENEVEDIKLKKNTLLSHIADLKSEFELYEKQFSQKKTMLDAQINKLRHELQIISDIQELEETEAKLKLQVQMLKTERDEEFLYQECGLYEQKYDFQNSEAYKVQWKIIRDKQKQLVKQDKAVSGDMNWRLNGDLNKGKKMINNLKKLLIKAFNDECDVLINTVKIHNYDSHVNQMLKSRDIISNLGSSMEIAITPEYLDLKIDELNVALDYQMKKDEEKEERREARERLKEQRALQQELDEAREKFKKEQRHYEQAMSVLKHRIQNSDGEERQMLESKKLELEIRLNDIDKSLAEIDYSESNERAGYVYVISNIGSFGKDIYKIGMTRRLEPMDRIYELGDASVPFRFDVHAMIFSDDAPTLESKLHKAFENRKINKINQRREFFGVTLEEIKAVIKSNFDKTVEFIDFPEADEYRRSLKLRSEI